MLVIDVLQSHQHLYQQMQFLLWCTLKLFVPLEHSALLVLLPAPHVQPTAILSLLVPVHAQAVQLIQQALQVQLPKALAIVSMATTGM